MIHAKHLPYNAWHILSFPYVLKGKAAQSQSLALQLTDCVNLYQWNNLYTSLLPSWKMRFNNTHLVLTILWGLNEVIHRKHVALFLVDSKCSINLIYYCWRAEEPGRLQSVGHKESDVT